MDVINADVEAFFSVLDMVLSSTIIAITPNETVEKVQNFGILEKSTS
jgi:hypothetical protein